MSGRYHERSREALSRLPTLDLAKLRELWCQLYKTETAPRLSRELLVRAVAYRMQEVAAGGPRLELQRQLRQIALELQQTGRLRILPQLKPGTRLMREWQGQSHEVLVLDDGFSWQGVHYRSLSAIARDGVVGPAVFWAAVKPIGHFLALSVGCDRPADRSPPCRGLIFVIGAARSTPANLPRKGSNRNSTRSQRSARPARPISAASSTRAGCWPGPATTMAGSRVAIWSGRRRCNICSPTSGLTASTS